MTLNRQKTDMIEDRVTKQKLSDTLSGISSSLADIVPLDVKKPPSGLTACKMDGTTDDSVAFQAIVNYAYAHNLPVYLPTGTMKLNTTINIPVSLTIVGNNDIGQSNLPYSVIWSTANPVFQPNGYTGTKISTSFNLYKVRVSSNKTSDAFRGFTFNWSIHEGLDVENANIVYNNCNFTQLSEVRYSQFYQIYTSFLVGQIYDSYIHHNYIDGNTANNASIAFNWTYPATCWVHHNYIDFWDQVFVFDSSGGSQWTISDNIIDYCRVGITGRVANGIISSNKFNQCSTSSKSKWANPNSNMNNSWYAMGGSSYWGNVRIVNNIGISTDILMNFYQCGSFNNIFTSGNNCTGTTITWLSSSDPSGSYNTNIYFQEMMYQTVTSLPDPRVFVNSNVIVSFLGQIIKYNGQLYYNDNQRWRLLNGDFTSSAQPTSGTWEQSSKIWNSAPTASGSLGWICITKGTMDSISTTCNADGSTTITNIGWTWLTAGQYIKINGTSTIYKVVSTSNNGASATLDQSVPAGTGLTLVNSAPVFKTFGTVGA